MKIHGRLGLYNSGSYAPSKIVVCFELVLRFLYQFVFCQKDADRICAFVLHRRVAGAVQNRSLHLNKIFRNALDDHLCNRDFLFFSSDRISPSFNLFKRAKRASYTRLILSLRLVFGVQFQHVIKLCTIFYIFEQIRNPFFIS